MYARAAASRDFPNLPSIWMAGTGCQAFGLLSRTQRPPGTRKHVAHDACRTAKRTAHGDPLSQQLGRHPSTRPAAATMPGEEKDDAPTKRKSEGITVFLRMRPTKHPSKFYDVGVMKARASRCDGTSHQTR